MGKKIDGLQKVCFSGAIEAVKIIEPTIGDEGKVSVVAEVLEPQVIEIQLYIPMLLISSKY